ncbi:uncharacterized protein MELLADRAFT_86326 [Melampsora larici-populina 98AG31]|uniref:rRNA biogenesis protein RRP36 n=1 Tax=Melampsora larici-populina (strain 98AG31 / pathotype 3-4-7) TaxID=747676 RepID=F4RLC9_MELLP|nr:uncharacterized protein MELLADRAFT_86326 [Melampsora larici-populina 98AG31]EGG06886.1 hypothetical protein MELLADRAFT_86326 [Melampsora larici-populina 98AG31]
MSRYIAESELEDGTFSNEDDDSQSDHPAPVAHLSIGALLKSQKQAKKSTKPETKPSKPAKLIKKVEQSSESESESEPEPEPESNPSSSYPRIQQRTNKHAPMVMSSKRSVTRRRTVVSVPKLERRDPRFDSLSGAIDPSLHSRSYGFLKTERKLELETLRKTYQKAKSKPGTISEIELKRTEESLRRAENFEIQNDKIEREREALKKWKTEEKAKQQDGKNPFYLKKTLVSYCDVLLEEQKEVILADRFDHLSQDKRKLQNAVERKRKKVAGKEKKSMPAKRARS